NRVKSLGGRPRFLCIHDERKLVRIIDTGEARNAVEAQRKLEGTFNIQVSADTIRRALIRKGLKGFVKVKKPLLNVKHKRQRLEFARKYTDSQNGFNVSHFRTFFAVAPQKRNLLPPTISIL